MSTLYIINQPQNLAECLQLVTTDDGLLLIENAVTLAGKNISSQTTKLFVLEEDLLARGLDNIDTCWQTIDYAEFVKQTLAFDKNVSWL